MLKIIHVNKPVGLTPLETIKKIREIKPELHNKKIAYAGRLDPLAQGVLLLMIGDETKNRQHYLDQSKSYIFEIVFGLQTDSYDLLGYLKETEIHKQKMNINLFVNTFVNKSVGDYLQSYPPYSSKPVNGKPLFWWAKNNKLEEIIIPQRHITITDFSVLKTNTISIKTLKENVFGTVPLVNGDFRQEMILQRWEELFSKIKNSNQTLPTATFQISCSSGTYIRSLAHQMGQEAGCGAITITIIRTDVGAFSIKTALQL